MNKIDLIEFNIIGETAAIDFSLLIFLIADNLGGLLDSFDNPYFSRNCNIFIKTNNYRNSKAPKNSPCLKEGNIYLNFTQQLQ